MTHQVSCVSEFRYNFERPGQYLDVASVVAALARQHVVRKIHIPLGLGQDDLLGLGRYWEGMLVRVTGRRDLLSSCPPWLIGLVEAFDLRLQSGVELRQEDFALWYFEGLDHGHVELEGRRLAQLVGDGRQLLGSHFL